MNNELISIIIPVYNVESYIDETINSVLNQTYSNWELICIDDCSTDNSYMLLQNYENKDPRIKILKNEYNQGPSKTRNKGVQLAKGRYITFLDSDDIWNQNKLFKQYTFMKENHYEFTFTSYNLMKFNGELLNKEVHVPTKIDYNGLLKNTVISTITVMISSDLKEKIVMPENISNGEDMAAWLNVLKNIKYAYGLDEVLSSYRQVNNSLSSGLKNKLTRMWYVYREVEKISLLKSIKYYVFYIFNVLRKRKNT